MAFKKLFFIILFAILSIFGVLGKQEPDRFRPKFHFSIASNWINDPNGMTYYDGEWHLQYQYHPFDTVWGPMHWGHSVSTDLLRWTDLQIALYPDHLGTIFSGSAVMDLDNTTGFQIDYAIAPMIAIFTHAGATQQQSIAYSLDKGRTFTKLLGNPVIPNPGIPDFRDPKVVRYENKWVLVLAAGNKIMFYSSPDLKRWELTGEFGADPEQGGHGGVWECPDLFPMQFGGETVWVLIVSINPGGPNGGSVTQYFIGDFDGFNFTSPQMEALWMDWGVDNYAAVSFDNAPSGRIIMMGWMNNWDYANQLPTGADGWRGQMTLPREMGLTLANGNLRLTSIPSREVRTLWRNDTLQVLPNQALAADEILTILDESSSLTLLHIKLTFDMQNFSDGASLAVCFLNGLEQEVCTGYDKGREFPVFVDRERSGLTDFNPSFRRRPTAKRELVSDEITFEIYLDVSSIEVFVDGGLTPFTLLYYPDEPYNKVEIRHHASGNPDSVLVLTAGEIRGLRLHVMSEIP